MIFIGHNGCGKTHLAVSIARYRLEAGDSVLFMVVPDLLDYLRATYAPTHRCVTIRSSSRCARPGCWCWTIWAPSKIHPGPTKSSSSCSTIATMPTCPP
ncbi:ATP-binding protein [Dictyobacter kobayashii]|uniref:ATP-binding protein n=1 Tax=Dictyobacter kobayashii TaxID=2014872 RepID=UPI0013872BA1